MTEPDDELLTVDDVAALWKVNKSWIYDQYESGRLEGVKLSYKILRFRRSAVRKFVQDNIQQDQLTPRATAEATDPR